MLKRKIHGNGVVTYQSTLLADAGVKHGFSTRVGGVSVGAFGTLNLGNAAGGMPQDEAGHLVENYRRFQDAIGCGADVFRAWVSQVHGQRVELVEREPEGEYGETLEGEMRDRFSGQLAADALATRVPGILLTIRVADCVPILLASKDGKIVGAAHAGWRGVAGNIVEKTVGTMHEAGVRPEELLAAIGPGISVEHFEVGEEVAAKFFEQGLERVVRKEAGKKPHVDLQGALRIQLERAGVMRIEGNDLCAFRDAANFYSHRRDHGMTGRMAGAICCRE